MRAVSAVIITILILLILVNFSALAYLFLSGMLSRTTMVGEEAINETVAMLMSCAVIESSFGNKLYLRNCGRDVIDNSSLKLYVDDVLVNSFMYPPSIAKGEVATINISKSINIPYKEHEIKITTPMLTVQKTIKFGNARILLLGDWYSDCFTDHGINSEYWLDYVLGDQEASEVPSNYMDYDIIYLRGDNNSANVDINETRLDNFLSAGKGVFVISASCRDNWHFGCEDDAWFPATDYFGSAMAVYRIINTNHFITQGYSGNYDVSGWCCCESAGYNGTRPHGIVLTTEFGTWPKCCESDVDCGGVPGSCVPGPWPRCNNVNQDSGDDTYRTIVGEYKGGRIVWDDWCMVDVEMFKRAIEWLSPWNIKKE